MRLKHVARGSSYLDNTYETAEAFASASGIPADHCYDLGFRCARRALQTPSDRTDRNHAKTPRRS